MSPQFHMSNWTEQDLLDRDRVALASLGISKKRQGRVRNVSAPEERIYNGRVYASKAECRFAAELDIQKRCAAIADWTAQVPYAIVWPGGRLICQHIVDFEVIENDGRIKVFEVKGWQSEVWRLKRKLFAAMYPKVEYVVVKA